MTVVQAGAGVLAKLEEEWNKGRYLALLDDQLCKAGLPAVELEVRFHPERKWRMDRAWRAWKVAIEYQGGLFVGARRGQADEWKERASHRSLGGMLRDHEKSNEAQVLGWVVLLANAASVRSGKVLEWAERALVARGWAGRSERMVGEWRGARRGETEVVARVMG